MNKIITLLLTTVLSLSALEWHSYEEAVQLAKKSTKLIMIDIVRTNCHYCENMDKAVFQDKEMSQWLDARFIAVKLNLDTDTMPLGIEVRMTPTFYFINKDENIVKKVPGSWSIEDFQSLTKDLK
jgi:thioredoxin-related protein